MVPSKKLWGVEHQSLYLKSDCEWCGLALTRCVMLQVIQPL